MSYFVPHFQETGLKNFLLKTLELQDKIIPWGDWILNDIFFVHWVVNDGECKVREEE